MSILVTLLLGSLLAGVSYQAPCTRYGFHCYLIKAGNDNELTVLGCGDFRDDEEVKPDSPITCNVFSTVHDLVLALEYRDLDYTPLVDYVQPALGSYVRLYSINRLNLNVYVRAYTHTFSSEFPPTLSGLAVNIAKTKCIDFAAFAWTGLQQTNQLALVTSLESLGKTVPYADNQTLTCYTGALTGDMELEGADCLFRANYSLNEDKSVEFFLRSSNQITCERLCRQRAISSSEFRLTRESESPGKCMSFRDLEFGASSLKNGLFFGLGAFIVAASVITYYVVRGCICPCGREGRCKYGRYETHCQEEKKAGHGHSHGGDGGHGHSHGGHAGHGHSHGGDHDDDNHAYANSDGKNLV